MSGTGITLGILAGGQAKRLDGLDKAWLQRDGVPQVVRWQRRFAHEVDATLVSVNRDPGRYADIGLQAIADRRSGGHGPIAGLEALAGACNSGWLLTVPVDLVSINDSLVPTLIAEAADNGACAVDDDGLQPLVALWRVSALRDSVIAAIDAGETAVHALQARLGLARVRFRGVRFGNLNTHDDLAAAGIALQGKST